MGVGKKTIRNKKRDNWTIGTVGTVGQERHKEEKKESIEQVYRKEEKKYSWTSDLQKRKEKKGTIEQEGFKWGKRRDYYK